ncbi:DUF7927 domain-containing protein [Leucobacter sp. USHLN153]|uniref:DUF7927 domain-containing protein n=1 Tax=Leucobacter sp. USHLN153 TaxID=3081268 RepID=UPI003019BDED
MSAAIPMPASGYCQKNPAEWDAVQNKARALGYLNTPQNPQTNRAVSTNTTAQSPAPAGPNLIMFQTEGLRFTDTQNRFITFSVDAAATACDLPQASDPLLRFYIRDAQGNETPMSSAAINPCTDPRHQTVKLTSGNSNEVRYGSFFADGSRLIYGDAFDIVIRNEQGLTTGNDGAFDNIRVSDVTPQLDKSFSPTDVDAGGISRLTFTVTNRSDLAEKNGWAFTDTLPDGLKIATPANVGGTCEDANISAAGDVISVTHGKLAAGEASCTIEVDVTSEHPLKGETSPIEFTNGPDNITGVVGLDEPDEAQVRFHSVPELEVAKDSDANDGARAGDTVTYTVEATNTGDGSFTAARPAIVFDDLSGVLDDADLDEASLTATVDGEAVSPPERIGDSLSWSGPLKSGEKVVITYQVTLKKGGDQKVENVAFVAPPGTPPTSPPPAPEGECEGNPQVACHAFEMPELTIAKTASRSTLPKVGEEVAFTVTVTNQGPGDFTDERPATMSDDLSRVLDDAEVVGQPEASTGEASIDGSELSWSGELAAGDTATITYTLNYSGAGDQQLINAACVPEALALDGENCAEVMLPGSLLSVSKTSSSDDDPLVAGSVVNYTLTFDNGGQAAAEVDYTDVLAHVLDDAVVSLSPTTSHSDLQAALDGGRLQVTGTVPPGEAYAVTYSVKVNDSGARGDDILANYLVPTAECDDESEACSLQPPSADECVDTITSTCSPIAGLEVEKVADPAGGETVSPGQEVTYTLTFRNTGSAPAPVDTFDLLDGVLDDATIDEDVTIAGEGLEVTREGDAARGRLMIVGEIPARGTVTVTYTATVKAESEKKGDFELVNVLVKSSDIKPVCGEPGVFCVNHPLQHPTITLALPFTGAMGLTRALVLGGSLALLLLAVARRLTRRAAASPAER